jgi:hypothetical protein
MKKLLVLMLVLGLASVASATVIDVVPVDVGTSGGRLGGMDDTLQVGDVIGLKLVLNANAYAGYPSYDGYVLSSMDLSLDVVGAGSLSAGTVDKAGAPVWKYDAGLSPFGVVDDGDISNGLSQIAGVALSPVGGTDSIPNDLMWDLLLTCTGGGDVLIDLGINGLTEYGEFSTPSGGNYGQWLAATDADLGDLVIHQEGVPEPMTIALLGLGGLLLRRRK